MLADVVVPNDLVDLTFCKFTADVSVDSKVPGWLIAICKRAADFLYCYDKVVQEALVL